MTHGGVTKSSSGQCSRFFSAISGPLNRGRAALITNSLPLNIQPFALVNKSHSENRKRRAPISKRREVNSIPHSLINQWRVLIRKRPPLIRKPSALIDQSRSAITQRPLLINKARPLISKLRDVNSQRDFLS